MTLLTHDETLHAVLAAAGEIFGRPAEPSDDLFSLGGDSVNAVDFAVRLEALLGIQIELADLWAAESLDDLAGRLAEAGDPDRAS
jgi:acyl carrier protein